MAVIQDSENAVVSVWEPKNNTGAELVNEHGALCWNELYSNDVEAAKTFYTALFGWTTEPFGESYTIFKVGDRGNGGAMAITPEMGPIPPHWAIYIGIDDVDAAAEHVTAGCGNIMARPFDLPEIGRMAVVADPQGAAFGMFQMTTPGD